MYLWMLFDHKQVIGYSRLTVLPGSEFHRMLPSFPLPSLYRVEKSVICFRICVILTKVLPSVFSWHPKQIRYKPMTL